MLKQLKSKTCNRQSRAASFLGFLSLCSAPLGPQGMIAWGENFRCGIVRWKGLQSCSPLRIMKSFTKANSTYIYINIILQILPETKRQLLTAPSSVAFTYSSSIQHAEARHKSSVKNWKVLHDPIVVISVEFNCLRWIVSGIEQILTLLSAVPFYWSQEISVFLYKALHRSLAQYYLSRGCFSNDLLGKLVKLYSFTRSLTNYHIWRLSLWNWRLILWPESLYGLFKWFK